MKKANHCQLSQEAKEWIDGELLGDGSVLSYTSYSAEINYTSKYFEYIKYVSDTLLSFGIAQAGKIYKRYYKQSNIPNYQYKSCRYVELLPIRNKWYSNGKKIVPRDIKLTPLTCRQWYIGDGYLTKDYPAIYLCTYGFSVADVEWLVKQLRDLELKTTREPGNNAVYISAHSTQDFLAYIGKCPVECYQYKWDYHSIKREFVTNHHKEDIEEMAKSKVKIGH